MQSARALELVGAMHTASQITHYLQPGSVESRRRPTPGYPASGEWCSQACNMGPDFSYTDSMQGRTPWDFHWQWAHQVMAQFLLSPTILSAALTEFTFCLEHCPLTSRNGDVSRTLHYKIQALWLRRECVGIVVHNHLKPFPCIPQLACRRKNFSPSIKGFESRAVF